MAANAEICSLPECGQIILGDFPAEYFENTCTEKCPYHTTCLIVKFGNQRGLDVVQGIQRNCVCGELLPTGRLYRQRKRLMVEIADRLLEESKELENSNANRTIIEDIEGRIKALHAMLSKLV